MTRSFYLITPCGRTTDDVSATSQSAADLAAAHPGITFEHYLVFNNGVVAQAPEIETPPNYQAHVVDLGPTGSRAKARNAALDDVAQRHPAGSTGLVCFLDAGDVLLDRGALAAAFDGAAVTADDTIWAFAALIVGSDVRSTRRPRPLFLRKINNPFFIGATWPTVELALSSRFGEGSKEDWKYWLELLEPEPPVHRRSEVAYEYRVVSTTDHLSRKSRLFVDQYRFFSQHLGYGHGPRTVLSLMAHTLIAGTSWLRRSNRWRPGRWLGS